jgi:soluble lytic murein transglycosylase-like protein
MMGFHIRDVGWLLRPRARFSPNFTMLSAALCTALLLLTGAPAEAEPQLTNAPIAPVAPGATTAPNVLGAEDIKRYRQIFALIEAGRIAKADALLAQVENDVLKGYALFDKYMHPTAYRSRFKELSAWMRAYGDHPEARRIYKLALRKRADGAARPQKPALRRWREQRQPEISAFQKYNPARSTAERRSARKIERKVRSLVRQERPTQALNYVSSAAVKAKLTSVERARTQQWIAQSYFAEGLDDKALSLAEEIAERKGDAVPLAHWTAGLASWRKGDVARAANHFEAMAKAKYLNSETRAAGAYWAARAHLVARNADSVVPMLEIAADMPISFYSVLARRLLGEPIIEAGTEPRSQPGRFSEAIKTQGVARAVALAQLGRHAEADVELRRAQGRVRASLDPELLAIAIAHGLPSAQMQIADSLGRDYAAWAYPVPDFEPQGGYVLDRALVLAFVRQESHFLTRATSRVGARGLMQLMPRTAMHVTGDRSLARDGRERLYDPQFNLKLGQAYLQELLGRGSPQGNLFMLAVAYNGGPGNLHRWRKEVDADHDPLLFIESIPSRETRNFVENVLTNLWIYRTRMDQNSPSLDAVAEGAWPVYTSQEKASRTLALAR